MFDVVPLNGQTWLICGGRDFADQTMFDAAMHDLLSLRGCPSHVIHGGARGADLMAHEWAHRHALDRTAYVAQWDRHGKAAGRIRNQQMLDEGKPSMVVAFPGGRGTADMVARARKAGVDVAEIQVKP